MAEAEDLFEVRNNFYLGNYQSAINEANARPRSVERDFYLCRSFIAQGNPSLVLMEVKDDAHPCLKAVKLLAEHELDPKKNVIEPLEKLMGQEMNDNLLVIASIVYLKEGLFDSAFKVLSQTTSLEGQALLSYVLLRLHRPDLADKQIRQMAQKDDDATITQLAMAWLGNFVGGEEKSKVSGDIYQELVDKFVATPTLLNALAVCSMGQGQFENAEKFLLQALEKDAKFPDTLANLVVCSEHLGKPADVIARYKSQLQLAAPTHAFLHALKKAEDSFDSLCMKYAPAAH